MPKILIVPSILAGDLQDLEGEARRMEEAGADMLHVDVMDGKFVPRVVLGVDAVRKLRKATKLKLDVHLMISEPWKHVEAYARAGADRICVHVEAGSAKQVLEALKIIRKKGCKAGVATKPGTELGEVTEGLLKECDFVMPMTVEPGKAGQPFMHEVLPKIVELGLLLKKMRLRRELEADGGVNPQTAKLLAQKGITVLVAGAAIFGAADAKKAIAELRAAAAKQ